MTKVCKRFLSFCDEVKLKQIIITNDIKNKKEPWFYTKEQFNHNDGIDVTTFLLWRSKFRFDHFIKRLYFRGTYAEYKALNLQDFTQLEQMTMFCTDNAGRSRTIEINLPHLKVLHELRWSHNYNVQLNTPKLEMLKCESFDFLTIQHPDSIKHVEFVQHNRGIDLLKNVEYLKLDMGFLIRNEHHISSYPKLETLHCIYSFDDDEDDDEEDYSGGVTHNEFKTEAMNALRQIRKQLPYLQIFFQSVELQNLAKIDEYEPQNHLAFQINNYGTLCDDIFYDDKFVDYNELMKLVDGNLPVDFYKKYFNIRSMLVTDNVESVENLVEFLKRLEYLKDLWLQNVSFDQSFYDRLPEMDQLTYLNLDRSVKPITNYDFLFKMNRLTTLQIYRNSAEFFDLTLALYRELKHFIQISFVYEIDEESFTIFKTSTNVYNICRRKENANYRKSETIFEKRGISLDELGRLLIEYKNSGVNRR